MLSKRISKFAPALAGAALAGLGVSQALASLVVDVRAMTVLGGGGIVAGSNGKAVTGAGVGTTVIMQVWGQVTGSAGNSTPGIAQAIQTITGSFLSNGALLGNLNTLSIPSVFKGNSFSTGFQSDLDGDGDLDIGSNNTADNSNFFSARATQLTGPNSFLGPPPNSTVNPITGGSEYLMATIRDVITSANGATDVNFRALNTSVGGVWAENVTEGSTDNFDGTTSYSYGGGTNGDPSNPNAYHGGTPVNIAGGSGGVTPEPASLGLIGMAGLGLLARRRKD